MFCAQVAQLVEQRTENPCVGGSNPPLGTINIQIHYIINYNYNSSKMNDLKGLNYIILEKIILKYIS